MGQLQHFRPTIWSRNFIVNLDKAFVFRNIVNTNYEGEITGYGNIVKINEIGDITVNDYTEDSNITYQTLTDAQKELVIDQKKYFAFEIDDVAVAQANVSVMQSAMQKAAHSVGDVIDQFIAELWKEHGLTTSNFGDSSTGTTLYAISTSAMSILQLITKMHQFLDEANAPALGRWAVLTPAMHAYLKYAGITDNLTGNLKRDDGTPVGPGFIGSLLGFDFFSSNNVDKDTSTPPVKRVMFGVPDAISFAGQVTKIEPVRRDARFADAVRGLYVYGAKVVRPDYLGVAFVEPSGLST